MPYLCRMETTHIALEGRSIPLHIRRHCRARRISLKLSAARDGIILTLPPRAPVEAGMKFFRSKMGWVLANIETDQNVTFAEGAVLPVLGTPVTVRCLLGRGLSEIADGELRVYCKPEFAARRVRDFLKKLLQAACLERAQQAAVKLGKSVRGVTIRDTRSRWGSCSARGELTFHWQLIFAPTEILDYLIAHETAHLKEMNHSDRFWQIVAQLDPSYKHARQWLKREGHRLHRYGK